MAELRAAVIGAGILGRQHAAYLQQHAAVDLVAVADLRAETAESLATTIGASAYTDYADMLRQVPLDLVVVATPDPLHRDPVVAAVEAGVPNIIQEKPFATTLADAAAIYESVERHGARLFVNYANRASPMDIATHYVIQSGLLGRPVYGEVHLDDNISVPTRMWGNRTREWAAGSSTAHFLLSHVVDLLRWYLAPAEITEVYAVSKQEVLGYTPDLYDAFLTFDNGMQVRAKAEWIKHMDELLEFELGFSGAAGSVTYRKYAGFGATPGWRANLAESVAPATLLGHQERLLELGVNVAARVRRPEPTSAPRSALECRDLPADDPEALVGHFIAAILEETLEPASWRGNGALPTHWDGLQQARITAAIVASAIQHSPVRVER